MACVSGCYHVNSQWFTSPTCRAPRCIAWRAWQICLLTAFLHPAEFLSGLHPCLERKGVQIGCVSSGAKSKCWHQSYVASFVCQHTHVARLMSNSFSLFCSAKRPIVLVATGFPGFTLRMRHIPNQGDHVKRPLGSSGELA